MKPVKYSLVAAVSLLLSACASAPPAPTVQMQSIDGYATMSCDDMRNELQAVGTWQQYHASLQDYNQNQASSMQAWSSLGSVLGSMAGQMDPSMASTMEASNQSNAVSIAQVQNAAEQSGQHQAGLAKRQSALTRMMKAKGC